MEEGLCHQNSEINTVQGGSVFDWKKVRGKLMNSLLVASINRYLCQMKLKVITSSALLYFWLLKVSRSQGLKLT